MKQYNFIEQIFPTRKGSNPKLKPKKSKGAMMDCFYQLNSPIKGAMPFNIKLSKTPQLSSHSGKKVMSCLENRSVELQDGERSAP